MSILFDADTEQHQITADSSFANLEAMTVIFWYNATTVTTAQYFICANKVTSGGFFLFRPSGGPLSDDWKFKRFRATTHSEVTSTGNIVQVGRWEFVAIGDDAITLPEMVHGTLTARPTKPSLFVNTKGVGAVISDSGNNLFVGTGTGLLNSAHAHLGFLGIWNRRMSVAEMQAQWQRPKCTSGCVLFTFPGLHGSTKLIDLSGNKNNGVLDGAPTWSAPPPLPFRLSGRSRIAMPLAAVAGLPGFSIERLGINPLRGVA